MPRKKQDTLTRAERVRRRRGNTRPQPRRAKTVAAHAHAASGTPVVVSRYGVLSGAAVPVSGRVRRQVRVSRGRNTEVVASVPALALGWRWLSLGLSVFLIVLIAALWYAPVFRVDAPEVRGLQYLDAGQVASRLGVVGRPVFGLDPALVAEQVEALPAVAHVEVHVALPNRVVVTVQERQPVLVWHTGRKTWWVDARGVAFAPPVAEAPPQALQVRAAALPEEAADLRPGEMQLLSPAQVEALQTLARYLPQGTPLVFSARYGIGWQAPEGWQVFVGQKLTHMEQRMVLYEAIARWLKAQHIHPALVNVASFRAPYYRMEP